MFTVEVHIGPDVLSKDHAHRLTADRQAYRLGEAGYKVRIWQDKRYLVYSKGLISQSEEELLIELERLRGSK